jgi:hypothetical protein
VSRIGYLAREHWFDLLVAVLAIAGMLELAIGEPERRNHVWLFTVASLM